MLVYKKGDLLEASENVICHQCNTLGTFGGGLAAQIKLQYPECERVAMEFANAHELNELVGTYCVYESDKYSIANCFSQNVDYTTNLEAIVKIFSNILNQCSIYGLSIAIPYMYGCGIAKGNWFEVRQIFAELSDKYNIDITVYHLEDL